MRRKKTLSSGGRRVPSLIMGRQGRNRGGPAIIPLGLRRFFAALNLSPVMQRDRVWAFLELLAAGFSETSGNDRRSLMTLQARWCSLAYTWAHSAERAAAC